MTRTFLTASVALFALAAPAIASAGPHQNKGGGKAAAQAESAAPEAPRQRAEGRVRGDGGTRAMQRMESPRPMRAERSVQFERPMRAERQMRVERPMRIERQMRVERPMRAERIRQVERADRKFVQPRAERKIARVRHQQEAPVKRIREQVAPQLIDRRPARIAQHYTTPRGLPQSLGRHDMGLHRGEIMRAAARPRVRLGERLDRDRYSAPVPLTYRTRYVDTPDYYYRYDDDANYLYRVARNDNIVNRMIPLYGYSLGDPWRDQYQSGYMPLGYRSLYYNTPNYDYRYGGNAIYQVDPTTQLITAVVALLTGQNLGVGQMLPSSYGVYNVPDAYRSSYYDTPDNWYRYGDGNIYQVDSYSRQIEASYPLYGGDYDVGSRWPVAYPDYNVPYGYRDDYYDTPQYQYRYADNGIYQVDPQTQLIQALVSLVSGRQFSVGQPMPAGYGVYNVPDAYRDRYYDTADSMYRYNDGYVYQVDPRTGLVERFYAV